MLEECWMWLAVFGAICIFGGGAMLGFFRTKTVGFGAYTAGVLLILLVLIIAALLAIGGILEPDIIANILLVALGFAGGLFTRINSTKKGGGKPDPGTD